MPVRLIEHRSGIVRTDAKGNRSLSPNGAMIRANRSHSHRPDVEPGPASPLRPWHGIEERLLPAIRRRGWRGLPPMSRGRVHLSADPAAAGENGRGGRTVVLGGDTAAMPRDGHVFGEAENGGRPVERVPPTHLPSWPSG